MKNKLLTFDWRNFTSLCLVNNRERVQIDATMQNRIFNLSQQILEVPENMPSAFYSYWEWYAGKLGKEIVFYHSEPPEEGKDKNESRDWDIFGRAISTGNMPLYNLNKSIAMAYRPNLECIFTDLTYTDIQAIQFTNAGNGATQLYERSPDAWLAIALSSMGFCTILIPNPAVAVSKFASEATQTENIQEYIDTIYNRNKIEKNPEWIKRWNIYASGPVVQNPTTILGEDDLLGKIFEYEALSELNPKNHFEEWFNAVSMRLFYNNGEPVWKAGEYDVEFGLYKAFLAGQIDDKRFLPLVMLEEKYEGDVLALQQAVNDNKEQDNQEDEE